MFLEYENFEWYFVAKPETGGATCDCGKLMTDHPIIYCERCGYAHIQCQQE